MDINTTLPLNTGRAMPIMGLGTWQLTTDTAGTVEEALHRGYRMIDTSGDYGTQPGIGEAIRRSGVDRAEIFLVTKVEENEDAYEATGKNLDELRLDHADLMLIHRPPSTGPGHELWEGLIRAREEGLTTDIGVSNYTDERIGELIDSSGVTPSVNQIEWSPFGWSQETREAARQNEVVIQAYSPLTRARRLDDARLVSLASTYGKTPAQLLLRWNLQHRIAPLPKANRRDHLRENVAIFDFEMGEAEMGELDALNEHYSALGSLPYV